jgi:hypothetical protein
MGRGDPGLREAADHQQLPQMPRVSQSVFARCLRPFRPRVSADSARWTSAPIRSSSSTTNRQPVVASNATSRSAPSNRVRNRRTPARSAGVTRARDTRFARDADPSPSPASSEHHPVDSRDVIHTPASSQARRASHTVNHGRYLLIDWPAAWPLSARAYSAVRRGGPATFTAGHVNRHVTSFGEDGVRAGDRVVANAIARCEGVGAKSDHQARVRDRTDGRAGAPNAGVTCAQREDGGQGHREFRRPRIGETR